MPLIRVCDRCGCAPADPKPFEVQLTANGRCVLLSKTGVEMSCTGCEESFRLALQHAVEAVMDRFTLRAEPLRVFRRDESGQEVQLYGPGWPR